MEANLKETQLTFSKGITNVPSDNLCDDNTLSDGYGLRVKDGELKAVRSAKAFDSAKLLGPLVYVHKVSSGDNLIYVEGGALKWATHDEDTLFVDGAGVGISVGTNFGDGKGKITSIGNILIATNNIGLQYAIWKGSGYKVVEGFPELSIGVASCEDDKGFLPSDWDGTKTKDVYDNFMKAAQGFRTNKEDEYKAYLEVRDTVRNEYIGLVEGAYKNALSKGYFTYPFWLRVAIRLYDGSYVMISNPVLALPTIRCGSFVTITDTKVGPLEARSIYANLATRMKVIIDKIGTFDGLEDIVDKIVIFASDQVKTWEEVPNDEWNYDYNSRVYTTDTIRADGSYASGIDNFHVKRRGNITGHFGERTPGTGTDTSTTSTTAYKFTPVYYLTDSEIIDKLVNTSVFYKIAEIKPDSDVFSNYVNLDSLMEKHTLENLTTQEQLPHDDYYGHCRLEPNYIYIFNHRLQIANVRRIPYDGGYHFSARENRNTMSAKVLIEGNGGNLTASTAICTYNTEAPFYFFYPDPNAKSVYFDKAGVTKKLTPHPRLNGAYYFNSLPSASFSVSSDSDAETVSGEHGYETLSDRVMTSEVNNPWTFNAEGDNSVGTGAIIGVCANTIALSQGQFGQHPLIVFTNEGIYALGTNSEGLYNTAYPLSREVCNNAKSITPTDGAIFFTSEKGLMMMVGSQITCVTEQLSGKTFHGLTGVSALDGQLSSTAPSFNEYIKECMIAYDYKEKCLLLINSSQSYYYVYDIASHAVTRCNQFGYQRVVNDYPDNLLQGTDGTVYTLLNKGDANDDTNTYDGMLLSRPCKFGNAQALKSLRQIIHVKDLNESAKMELHIYVSNDLKHWGEIHSLRGRGYKYFRFGMKFTGLKATDSYSGMLVLSQTRRTNKLR